MKSRGGLALRNMAGQTINDNAQPRLWRKISEGQAKDPEHYDRKDKEKTTR